MTKGFHVVKNGNRWSVKAEKVAQPLSQHNNQINAIIQATKVAKATKGELFIHRTDGRIRERNSFGNDPHPPKG